jgi:hypothetical protein
MYHNNSRNSSTVSPLCFRMSASVPLASTEFRRSPSLQIQFDGLAQIPASTFDFVALRSDTQFWTAGDVKVFFFGDQDRESVSHVAMPALPK